MADIWDSMLGGVEGWFGQQTIPDLQNQSASQLIGGIPVGQLAKKENRFNALTLAGDIPLWQQAENAYDPNAAALRAETSASLFKDMQNPYAIPADVQNMLNQRSAEGMGDIAGMQAGRALNAADFGMTSMDLYNNRLNKAMSFVRSSPTWNQLFQPDRSLTPGTGLQLGLDREQNTNNIATYLAQLQSANNQAAIRGTLTNDVKLGGAVMGMMSGMGGGASSLSSAPTITPSMYGGAGQPSFSTLSFAAPQGTTWQPY